jgi:uncharacterized protein YbcI
MGRGPKNIHAYLIGDLLVVRLQGVLTVAEQQLVASLPAEKGRDLLKQVRVHLQSFDEPLRDEVGGRWAAKLPAYRARRHILNLSVSRPV